MALIWITEAKYVEGFKVTLTFNNGITETVDLKDHLEGDVFKPLNDPIFFKSFELDSWTLTWSNDSDFAPEFLYDLAVEQNKKAHNIR